MFRRRDGNLDSGKEQTRLHLHSCTRLLKIIDKSELPDVRLEVHNPDEKAEILQGVLLDVDEAYSHCPRALKFSRLWDVDEITKNVAKPPVGVKEPGI